jgi:hypothetical protein
MLTIACKSVFIKRSKFYFSLENGTLLGKLRKEKKCLLRFIQKSFYGHILHNVMYALFYLFDVECVI